MFVSSRSGIYLSVSSNNEMSGSSEPLSPVSRKRMELRHLKFITCTRPTATSEEGQKRSKVGQSSTTSVPAQNSANPNSSGDTSGEKNKGKEKLENVLSTPISPATPPSAVSRRPYPKYGVASVCGRRRDMEDAVKVFPSLCFRETEIGSELHFFGVYDGHGCSHVATKCKDRLHELVREEFESMGDWRSAMARSFARMDRIAGERDETDDEASCRCAFREPVCEVVGSTAVVAIVTAEKIIVSNCGDSRAVLSRNGRPIPLSIDQKPDRPDELRRIQEAGGHVIDWNGPRVQGLLAMSRAIGDNYLKPYVIPEPEVKMIDRTSADDCLILATDGLWDVVSNETACGIANACLREGANGPLASFPAEENEEEEEEEEWVRDNPCSQAAKMLMQLAVMRQTADNISVVVVDLAKDT